MLKNLVKFEHIVEEKTGQFLCEYDTPIAAAREMLCKFLAHLDTIEAGVKAQQEQAKAEAAAQPNAAPQDQPLKENTDEKAVNEIPNA